MCSLKKTITFFSQNVIGDFNPLSANPTNWSSTLKQFAGKSRVFDHFVGLALKEQILAPTRNQEFSK